VSDNDDTPRARSTRRSSRGRRGARAGDPGDAEEARGQRASGARRGAGARRAGSSASRGAGSSASRRGKRPHAPEPVSDEDGFSNWDLLAEELPGDEAAETPTPPRRGARRRTSRSGARAGAGEVLLDSEVEAELAEAARAAAAAHDDDAEDDEPETPAEPEGLPPLPTPDMPREEAIRAATARLGLQTLHAEQQRVIDLVLSGRDVLMVLPTGFGKSACYQIPSMVLDRPVLVISPLLALMRDQYEKLERREIPCVKLDGTVRGKARATALARIAEGGPLLVMTTPETLATEDAVDALSRSGVGLAAVDEAHCISEWGYDFRPAYLQLGERLRRLGGPPVLALTATATEKVRSAIMRFVGMRDTELVASSPHRSNLAFDVLRCTGDQRLRALVRLVLRLRRPGIVYCSTTREVDEIWAILQRFGIPAHRYHGKMNASERSKQQDGFMRRGRRTVMVATNAFGLGIDKQDIRYVLHYQAPASLEQYVQEAGRAGRDGRRSNCIMLFSHEDRQIHEALLSRSRVRPEQLYKLGRALAAWAAEEKVPSLQALALSADLGPKVAGALLAVMEEATLVKWDQSAVFVTVPASELEDEARKLAGQFETLRTQDARRLESVAAYAEHEECRAVFLREYFGEEGSEPCGLCDVCRGSSERPSVFYEPLDTPRNAPRRTPLRRSGGRGRKARTEREPARGRTRGGRRRTRGGRTAASANGPAEDERSGRRKRRGRRGRGRDDARPTAKAGNGKARPEPKARVEPPAGDGSEAGRRRRRRRRGRGRRGDGTTSTPPPGDGHPNAPV